MTTRDTVTVLIGHSPVQMYTMGSIPIGVAIKYDKMTREYNGNPPIADLVDFVKSCIFYQEDAGLVDTLTANEFKDLLEEWTAKSGE